MKSSSRTTYYPEIPTQVVTILTGVTQERRGELQVEDYYQALTDPQALQLDTRLEDLDLLYFSDYGTGYIYSVRVKEASLVTLPPPARSHPQCDKNNHVGVQAYAIRRQHVQGNIMPCTIQLHVPTKFLLFSVLISVRSCKVMWFVSSVSSVENGSNQLRSPEA